MKVRVLHSYYGCETGCCGHVVELDGEKERRSFDFSHVDNEEEAREFAKDYIEKNHKECIDSIDWDTFEFIGA